LELTENPTASLSNSPEPLQPSETAATKIWHYKHNNAALIGNVKACNSNFKYDYQIQEVLDWQQKNLNVTPTQLHKCNTKSNYNLSLSKNGRYPCSRAQGWKQQKQSPFQEAKRWTIAAKFAGARSAKSIQKEKKTMMICHNVDTCQNILLKTKVRPHNFLKKRIVWRE